MSDLIPTEGRKLLARAIEKFGVNKVARLFDWTPGSAADSLAGRRSTGPYRSAQLAKKLGEPVIPAVLDALAEQARDEDERIFWIELKEGEPDFKSVVNEIDVREIVESKLGPKYVFVVASGISRYLRMLNEKNPRTTPVTAEEVANLAYVAKPLFDAYEGDVFGPGAVYKVAIGARREWICEYLQDRSAEQKLVEFLQQQEK